MVHKQIPRDGLVNFYREGLVKYKMSESCIERYVLGIRHLHSYMESEDIDCYTLDVGTNFSEWIKHAQQYSQYIKSRDIRATTLLALLIQDKPYEYRRTTANYELPGETGRVIKSFVKHLEETKSISNKTKTGYLGVLNRLAIYTDIHGLFPKDMSMNELIKFLSSKQNSSAHVLGIIRRFSSYMYDEHIVGTNLAVLLEGIRPKRREKLPSYYDKEEVIKIEQAVDRTCALGKRDYAIILLASRLGLRSSDISRLTFSDLDWDANKIHIVQYKTQKPLTLPLLSDVGNAIIDYARYGRPKTDRSNIFVTANRPYGQISSAGMSSIVTNHIYKAGIEPKGRHTGSHSLRRSLATTLLENDIMLPVISECLGHSCSTSTMHYLGIDVKSLLECSLEVPLVREDFYNQKGGMLYE